MGKKIVVINDFTVRDNHGMDKFKVLEEEYGCSVQFVEDRPEITTSDAFSEMFLKMEKEGPDVLPVNENLVEAMKDADIVISHISPIPSEGVNGASHLEAVCIMRSGVENVNVKNASEKGVKVINAPGRLAVPVSEFTVGLMIAEMKNIARAHTNIKNGEFRADFVNRDYSVNLKGKNVGLVGCGAVGRRVARIMKAFEANVLIFDPYTDAEALEEEGYRSVSLNELCKESDVISVHYRLTPETKGMIGAEQFALMKPTCFLINTARAGLVDEDAMMDALINKKIGGAGLDVFHQEPLPENHPFFTLENVTLTPHLAGTCSNIFDMTYDIMKDALDVYLKTGKWKNRVN